MPFDGEIAPPSKEVALLGDMRRTLANPWNWCKNSLYRHAGWNEQFCLMGALNKADHGHFKNIPLYPRATCLVSSRLSALTPHKDSVEFNNDRTTKHQDILDLIDRAKASFAPALQDAHN